MKLYAPSRAVGVASVGLLTLVVTTIFAQQISGAQPSEQTTVKLVGEMISKYHISQKPLDDRVSGQLLHKFIKELDPQKLYFLKSDNDGFARYRDQLDDLLKVGQVNFAHEAFNLYLKRLDERVTLAHQLIDASHDFSLDESIVIDGEQLPFASDMKEMNDRWRKRIKYELLSLQLDKTSVEDARKRLHKRYDTLKKYAHDTEDSEVLEMFL
jgi:carboxyl-terminal processing protease